MIVGLSHSTNLSLYSAAIDIGTIFWPDLGTSTIVTGQLHHLQIVLFHKIARFTWKIRRYRIWSPGPSAMNFSSIALHSFERPLFWLVSGSSRTTWAGPLHQQEVLTAIEACTPNHENLKIQSAIPVLCLLFAGSINNAFACDSCTNSAAHWSTESIKGTSITPTDSKLQFEIWLAPLSPIALLASWSLHCTLPRCSGLESRKCQASSVVSEAYVWLVVSPPVAEEYSICWKHGTYSACFIQATKLASDDKEFAQRRI